MTGMIRLIGFAYLAGGLYAAYHLRQFSKTLDAGALRDYITGMAWGTGLAALGTALLIFALALILEQVTAIVKILRPETPEQSPPAAASS